MAQAVHQWDQADAVPATEFGELPGLVLIQTSCLQFRVRLKLESVIDLKNQRVKAERSETVGDELLHGIELIGLVIDQMKGNPLCVLCLPILAPLLACRLRGEW